MGTYFGHLVDQEASVAEAPALAEKMRVYLCARGVIEEAVTDCALGPGGGYAPGPGHAHVLESEDSRFLELLTNGVEFVTERTVFHAGQGETSASCPACGETADLNEPLQDWQDAVGRWYEGDDDASLVCRSCSVSTRLLEWPHDPAWGFGTFAITFWNWPRLKPAFIEELEAHMGRSLVVVGGKI